MTIGKRVPVHWAWLYAHADHFAPTNLRRRINSPALISTVNYNCITCSLSIRFQISYRVVVYFVLVTENKIMMCWYQNPGSKAEGHSLPATWRQHGFEPGAGPGQRPHPKMTEWSEIRGEAGWSSGRKKMNKNEEKGHKKGMQLGN